MQFVDLMSRRQAARSIATSTAALLKSTAALMTATILSAHRSDNKMRSNAPSLTFFFPVSLSETVNHFLEKKSMKLNYLLPMKLVHKLRKQQVGVMIWHWKGIKKL